MAGTHAKAVRRAGVLQRLSTALGIEQADLYFSGRGDKEMALIITLERIADAVEDKLGAADKKLKAANKKLKAAQSEQPSDEAPVTDAVEDIVEDVDAPVTVETVDEKPLVTTEVVEVIPPNAGLVFESTKGDKDAS